MLFRNGFEDFFLFHIYGYEYIYEYIYLRFYLFIHERHTERGRDRQREKQTPCREHDVGLNPGIPGSHPEPKAGTKPLSHPGIPSFFF